MCGLWRQWKVESTLCVAWPQLSRLPWYWCVGPCQWHYTRAEDNRPMSGGTAVMLGANPFGICFTFHTFLVCTCSHVCLCSLSVGGWGIVSGMSLPIPPKHSWVGAMCVRVCVVLYRGRPPFCSESTLSKLTFGRAGSEQNGGLAMQECVSSFCLLCLTMPICFFLFLLHHCTHPFTLYRGLTGVFTG